MKHTAIVILNYNNYEDTISCIESVEQYNTASVKYIVVDNGSPREGTVKRLHEFLSEKFAESYLRLEDGSNAEFPLPKMTFLVSKTNDGYARGNNKGLRLAKVDAEVEHILILNNDILFIEDIIPELLHNLETLPQTGIVSPLLLKKNGEEIDYNCARMNVSNWELILTYLFFYRDPFGYMSKVRESQYLLKNNAGYKNKEYVEIDLPSGSCMLFKKELLEKILLFDSGTFLYYEENIIFKQEENIGLKNFLIPSLRCIHLGAASTPKINYSNHLKIVIDNATYYLKKYGKMTFAQKVMLPIAVCCMRLKCYIIGSSEKR